MQKGEPLAGWALPCLQGVSVASSEPPALAQPPKSIAPQPSQKTCSPRDREGQQLEERR